jgi:hypothetical protein
MAASLADESGGLGAHALTSRPSKAIPHCGLPLLLSVSPLMMSFVEGLFFD